MQLRSLSRLALVPAAVVGLALVVMVVAAPAARADAGGYIQVSAGLYHTCAIQQVDSEGAAGPVQCWGDNDYGQSSPPRGVSFTQITAGDAHTCGLKADGTVQCWGSNEKLEYCNAEESGHCEYIWTGQAIPPAGVLFKQISAGAYYNCGVRADGNVQCWGYNNKGQANYQPGSFSQVAAGVDHTCAVQSTGGVVCWGNDEHGKTTPPAGVSFAQITEGNNHTCGIGPLPAGNVACWGGNTWGQAPDYRAGPDTQISAGDLFTCAIRTNRALDCWGYNFYGQVKQAPTGEFKQVAAGGGHACAISGDGMSIACWGRNDHGQATPPMPNAPGSRYDFAGFYRPLAPVTGDVPVLNLVKAGSSVPLKFSLGGDKGLDVLEKNYPASGSLDCKSLDAGATLTPANSAGGEMLTYDPKSGQYTYVWKTEKTWTGCRYLSLRLVDGTEHRAAIQFK